VTEGDPVTPGEGTPRVPTRVMGVLNVTPDSFYDGGRLDSPDAVAACAARMKADGADILDVGGESSRPGAAPLSAAEEGRRVLPVLPRLVALGLPVSVDTYHAETARRSLEAGAAMVNDITALRGDPEMPGVVAEAGCPCVLMHMRGHPATMQDAPVYRDVVSDICAFFEERLACLTRLGIPESQFWLDPGFGFGKTVTHNLVMLQRLREFKRFGLPLLIGTSNKSTIGTVLDAPVEERMEGTAATVAISIWNGADCIRVHDVKRMTRVARMSDAIVLGGHNDRG